MTTSLNEDDVLPYIRKLGNKFKVLSAPRDLASWLRRSVVFLRYKKHYNSNIYHVKLCVKYETP
jgi:hypothetical protein